jgi:hypothetical protein
VLPRLAGWGRYGIGPPAKITDIREVSRWTALRFPPSAVLVDGYMLGGLSTYLIAKIRLPRGEVDTFLAQLPMHGEMSSTEVDYMMAMNGFHFMRVHRWQPPAPRRYLSTYLKKDLNNQNGVSLLLDLDNSQTAVLYVYYWS